MTLAISANGRRLEFDGPYDSAAQLKQKSGVYIITSIIVNRKHSILDVGESGNVQRRVANHDRADEWKRHRGYGLYVSAYYCDERTRMALEKAIRAAYNPACVDTSTPSGTGTHRADNQH